MTSFFHGPGLRLRPFEPGDVAALHAGLNHPDLAGRRYLPDEFPVETPLSLKQAEAVGEKWASAGKKQHDLVIVRNQDEVVVGYAHVNWWWDPHAPDLHLVIFPPYWRSGYGAETLDLLLGYLFGSTVAHNVSGSFANWNAEARAFAARCGFSECGGYRRAGMRQGGYYDEVVVDLLRPEWLARGGRG